MIINNIGIDLVEIERITKIGLDKLAERILSDKEKEEYHNIKHETRKKSYLAGRFAAKEAIFKAFKSGDQTTNFKDFEVLNDKTGAPYVLSERLKGYNLKISITHTEAYAAAFVILINED